MHDGRIATSGHELGVPINAEGAWTLLNRPSGDQRARKLGGDEDTSSSSPFILGIGRDDERNQTSTKGSS